MNKDSWNIMKLGEICNILNGYAFDSKYFTNNTNAMPLIRIRDIKRGYTETFYTGIYNESYIVKKGDYIIGMDGEFNICQWESTNALLNQRICKIWPRDTKSTHIRYIYYFLSSLLKKIEEKTAFVTVKHLSSKQLNSSDITIPVFSLQEQIVKELDTLSDIITKKKEQLAELDKLAQATFYDMFGDPVENEKNWKTTLIQNICTINPTKSSVKSLNSNLPVSFIPMAAVGEQGEFYANEIKLLHEVYKGFTYFEEGDILFAKITPCMENGKGAIARGLKNNIGFGSTEFHVLRPNSECNNSFLYFITKLDLFRKAAEKEMTGSAGQKRVPKSFLQKWTLILPPISLQNQFAEKIEAIEKQKALINQSITDTQLLFDYTMDKYFN